MDITTTITTITGMIDVHVHILPGLDDGASSDEEALKMARAACKGETMAVVATPHFLPGNWPGKSRVVDLVTELQGKLDEQKIALRVYPGGEVYLEPELAEKIQDVPLFGGQSNYLLVELPFDDLPLFTEEVLFQLRLKDVVPVLAHPERNRVIGEDLTVLAKWIQQGVLVQVNAGSLTGAFGRKVQAVAEAMVKAKMVHFVGSDGHSAHRRPPILTEAKSKVAGIAGEEEAERLCCQNAALLLAGEQIEVPEPEYPPRRSTLFCIRRLARMIRN
ncbi:tyrosine protein phosphatase [Thermanaeromonas sp. C210]|nr:tyrosine protein phosphatase [Thermanaeromonas sp. C210]